MGKERQTHYRERGQPEERRALGELEKSRDYLARRRAEKQRESEVSRIKKQIDEKNPDEFQFFIYSSRRSGDKLIPNATAARPGNSAGGRAIRRASNAAGERLGSAEAGGSKAGEGRIVFID